METIGKTNIQVSVKINAPVKKVWKLWTEPEHVVGWNQASDNWHTPRAENDVRTGGKFSYRMEAKDRSSGFDFSGTYTNIEPFRYIEYLMDDCRKVSVLFTGSAGETLIEEVFEAEATNSPELQRDGWQAILDNFKRYTEGLYI